jgi:hypothetical protein
MDVVLINEKCKGFESVWTFKCKTCNLIMTITSESNESNYLPLNTAIASGTVAIGIGYTQLAEFSASIDIPCMSPNTYTKYIDRLSVNIETTAWDTMKLAGIEEKRLAIEAGDIDEDGTPMCPVIADGQWSKRSYKT